MTKTENKRKQLGRAARFSLWLALPIAAAIIAAALILGGTMKDLIHTVIKQEAERNEKMIRSRRCSARLPYSC